MERKFHNTGRVWKPTVIECAVRGSPRASKQASSSPRCVSCVDGGRESMEMAEGILNEATRHKS